MHVVKWPRIRLRKKYVLLEFRQKCPKCKTIVEIDNLNDLDYNGWVKFEGGGIFNKLDHQYKWDYECPYCNRKQSLSDKNLDYITRFIDINNINLFPYEEMDRIKFNDVFHATPYYKYYGYWLGAKFKVTVHSSLKDDNVAAAFNEDPEMVYKLTGVDGKFISEDEFEKLFENSDDTKEPTNSLTDNIENLTDKVEQIKDEIAKESEYYKKSVQSLMREERCTRFRKVGYATDAEGRLNLCIDTNGPYCVLLVLGSDGSVTEQSLIPTANFRFYERINSSFGFENTRYRYW